MYEISEDGSIVTVQGDTVIIPLAGLKEGENSTLYFQLYDENRKFIGEQVSINTNGLTSVDLPIPDKLTDLLTVPEDEDYKTYYYGIKRVLNGFEDTLLIGENSDIGTLYTFTVVPKKAAGE